MVILALSACSSEEDGAAGPEAGGDAGHDDGGYLSPAECYARDIPLDACPLNPSDRDADGWGSDRDCDDGYELAYPGAPEIPCNGVDEDCDGADLCSHPPGLDSDRDGVTDVDGDCDDDDPARSPRHAEVPCNGLDENCDGADVCTVDEDGDGWGWDRVSMVGDCNDRDAAIHPRAPEVSCDGVDQDCSGTDCCDDDEDMDGFACRADCDDTRQTRYPGAPVPDRCFELIDWDCDGTTDTDCYVAGI